MPPGGMLAIWRIVSGPGASPVARGPGRRTASRLAAASGSLSLRASRPRVGRPAVVDPDRGWSSPACGGSPSGSRGIARRSSVSSLKPSATSRGASRRAPDRPTIRDGRRILPPIWPGRVKINSSRRSTLGPRSTTRPSSTALRTISPVIVASRASARLDGGLDAARASGRRRGRPGAPGRCRAGRPGGSTWRGRFRSRKVSGPGGEVEPALGPRARCWRCPVNPSSAGATQLWTKLTCEAVGPVELAPGSGRSRRGRAATARRGRGGPGPKARTGTPPATQWKTSQTWTACSTIQSPERSRRASQPSWPLIGPLLLTQAAEPATRSPSSPRWIAATPSRYRGFDRRWKPTWTARPGRRGRLGDQRGRTRRRSGPAASRRRGACRPGGPSRRRRRAGRTAGRRPRRRRRAVRAARSADSTASGRLPRGLLDDPRGREPGASARRRRGRRPRRPASPGRPGAGSSRALPRPIRPRRTGAARAAGLGRPAPARAPRPAAAEQPRNRRRLSWIGGIGPGLGASVRTRSARGRSRRCPLRLYPTRTGRSGQSAPAPERRPCRGVVYCPVWIGTDVRRASGDRGRIMAKHIFVTGGVVSSLGKGLTCASIGMLLEHRGLRVRLQKFDPYINVDPGTMSPYQHGEVYVLDDGARDRPRPRPLRAVHQRPADPRLQLHDRQDLPLGHQKEREGKLLRGEDRPGHPPRHRRDQGRRSSSLADRRRRRRHHRDRRHRRRHRGPAVPGGDPPVRPRRRPRELPLHPPDARPLPQGRGRAEDQADPALRRRPPPDRHPARHPDLPDRAPDQPRGQGQDRPRSATSTARP